VSEAKYYKVAIPYSPIIRQNCGQGGEGGGGGGVCQSYDCGVWALLEWRGDAGGEGRTGGTGNIFFVFLKLFPNFFL
jgi:hypothetical protein